MSTNNQYYSSPSSFENVNNFERLNMDQNMANATNATQTNIIPEGFQQNIMNQNNTGNQIILQN